MADELIVEDDEETTEPEVEVTDEEPTSDDGDLDIVAVDEEGNEYVEAPEGGLFGTDGLTNFQRTVNPSYDAREDGLVGVDEDYPAQASRGGGDDD